MQLTVTPRDGLVDDVPSITVSALDAEEQVTIRITVVDAAGVPWESSNLFQADKHGTLGTDRMSPLKGTYQGVDASGPWWSMNSLRVGAPAVAFTPCDDALTWTVHCQNSTGREAEVPVIRRWRGTGITRVEALEFDVRVIRFIARDEGPIVVFVPGSTGTQAIAPAAALLATRLQFNTIVIGYMGDAGQPGSLNEIPIEALAGAISGAGHGNPIAVVAYSVGTGGALAALALENVQVKAVVAISPTHVVWQALAEHGPPPKTSSWTHLGVPLPYVPIRGEKLLGQIVRNAVKGFIPSRSKRSTALRLLPAYSEGLTKYTLAETSAIPVENIAAPLMAVAGDKDDMWPAAYMAKSLIERRKAAGVDAAVGDVLMIHHDAGHFMRPPLIPTTVARNESLVSGGTPSGNAAAQKETWERMIHFLSRNLTE